MALNATLKKKTTKDSNLDKGSITNTFPRTAVRRGNNQRISGMSETRDTNEESKGAEHRSKAAMERSAAVHEILTDEEIKSFIDGSGITIDETIYKIITEKLNAPEDYSKGASEYIVRTAIKFYLLANTTANYTMVLYIALSIGMTPERTAQILVDEEMLKIEKEII